MRVIAGSSKGRPLRANLPSGVRPTSDRVKESMFDILGSMGGVSGITVFDLFCGSGALGIEAMSRGAREVTFIDNDPKAIEATKENISSVGLDANLSRLIRGTLPGCVNDNLSVDLVLCDPPYAFRDWSGLLGSIRADVVILESRDEVLVPNGWVVVKSRRYGGTLVTVVQPDISAPRV